MKIKTIGELKMNRMVIVFILLNFINCQETITPKDKLFNSKNLPLLLLENIDSFWSGDSIKYSSNYFDFFSAYQDGVELNGNRKKVGVAVFTSQAEAINCMEGRIDLVSCVIKRGEANNTIKNPWWYIEYCTPNAIFVNQWNTIIEISCSHSNYSEVEPLLKNTVVEIAKRIDELSN